jgi:hypothetical protein
VVELLRLLVLFQPQQQLRAHTRRVKPMVAALGKALQTQLGAQRKVRGFHRLENGLQRQLALARLNDAVFQACLRVGAQQVGVQRRLGRLGHRGVGGLCGDHDEHGGERQQTAAAQVVQQFLAGGRIVHEMLFAHHQVEGLELELAPCIGHARRLQHGAKPQIAQLRYQHRTGQHIAIDHQCGGIA